MLQRIQSVFLLLVALCMLLVLFFPLWTNAGFDNTLELRLTAWGFFEGEEEVYFPYTFIAMLAIASIVVAIIEISKFNNRVLQMKLGALNSLFMAGTLILAVWLTRDVMELYGIPGEYEFALFLPAVAMIFNVLANRFIRKDEKLVRSADRIR